MPALMTGWEKELAKAAFEHLPLTLLLIASVIVLAVVITIRYNQKINEEKAERKEQKLTSKQQGKIIKLLGSLPCVSKRDATRLGDPGQDDKFQDQPKCTYISAVEKGDV